MGDSTPAKLKICEWSSSRFRDNSCFFETGKMLILKLRIKNLSCLLHRNVDDDVLFQKHFSTDLKLS